MKRKLIVLTVNLRLQVLVLYRIVHLLIWNVMGGRMVWCRVANVRWRRQILRSWRFAAMRILTRFLTCLFSLLISKLFHQLIILMHSRVIGSIAWLLRLFIAISNLAYQFDKSLITLVGGQIRAKHLLIIRLSQLQLLRIIAIILSRTRNEL